MRLFGAAFGAALMIVATCGSGLADDRPGGFAMPLPDKTPGATRPVTAAALCHAHTTVAHATLSPEIKAVIFERYGIVQGRQSYVIDWLVPEELGGSNDLANLWPQLTVGPLNHGDKVKLETRLFDLVCTGQVRLATAQDALKTSWVDAYERYVGRYP